ncbi:MAG: hypothetical protein AVDCRST_MAG74-1610 [uncultured Pyrinomonadaceae bacterium]|uniref:Uncharacterized protein n=1 Tax=uncultured Pyrinomonadaceae bacterium TaxID=2283094 RepID=A0A6J4NYL0_9BACT|nr:MAG: hypothetical protein AVDCRST_MAG74-1610 [uncultured Pyrinomonadaceae bacterium]
MKQFLSAMRGSLGFVPIVLACLLFANYLFPNPFIFKGQSARPPLLFALSLFVFGVFWTLYFQRRAR